jgi:signal transduction histidine kinase
MQMESEATADIHLFRGEEGDWVLLLDAAEAARQRQQLQQKGNELSLSYQRLVKEIQKKEILLHAIVHDLAGPLMGIRGGFELLASEQLSPQGRELLDLGLRQASRQEQLIRDILQAFSAEVEALEAFTLDPARAPDAALCAREVIAALRPAFEINQVQLALETPDGSDFRVVGEKSRLERVISNLVENALRHSPPRSKVTIGCRIDPPHVLITIDDEGPGVPDALAAGLFQKFTQIPGKKAGKIGLGLYFCRLTVEHWGGTIGHETRSTGGSRFWFRLPRPGGAA